MDLVSPWPPWLWKVQLVSVFKNSDKIHLSRWLSSHTSVASSTRWYHTKWLVYPRPVVAVVPVVWNVATQSRNKRRSICYAFLTLLWVESQYTTLLTAPKWPCRRNKSSWYCSTCHNAHLHIWQNRTDPWTIGDRADSKKRNQRSTVTPELLIGIKKNQESWKRTPWF